MSAALSRVLRGYGVSVSGGRCCSSCRISSFSSAGLVVLRRPTAAEFYAGGIPAAGGWRPGLTMRAAPCRGLAMRMNLQIRAPMVRVVDISGDELGVLSREDALAAAEGE